MKLDDTIAAGKEDDKATAEEERLFTDDKKKKNLQPSQKHNLTRSLQHFSQLMQNAEHTVKSSSSLENKQLMSSASQNAISADVKN